MGDSDFHSAALVSLWQGLMDFFARVADVYVAMNLLFYWEQGNRRARRDPDILVAKGVGKHQRLSYRLWEEHVLPSVFFEVASRKTWRTDVGEKRQLYAELGIREYILFDPHGRFLDPPLQGFRLQRGVYVPLRPAADGSLTSRELGLRLVAEGQLLRLIDARTGRPVLTRAERAQQAREKEEQERQQREQAQKEARRARRQAREAEKRAEALAAELERLRAERQD
jgi:hypothetical protein